jgi:hypothetical protein
MNSKHDTATEKRPVTTAGAWGPRHPGFVMLRKSILVLATAVAVGATAAHSSSAFAGGWGGNSSRGNFGGSGHMSGGHWGRAHGGGFGSGDHMSGGHRRGGLCDGLAGGPFAWPYCEYCTRHPGDRNC